MDAEDVQNLNMLLMDFSEEDLTLNLQVSTQQIL